ncbi:hypothetical protein GEU84_013645 [Fertoebacter nigrum]|uniref:Uncharacterized protein n=1 Tax=Fertoeibacter niger TaxID=2656921 RepID=A0A8X8H3A4_9RHOB|nr:hypothetical protein [Fertoeibacter niger]NUB45437.1 hypothetical protein [Fertoeibacter niger]
MKRLFICSVAATLALALAQPVSADDFDLPPDLPAAPAQSLPPDVAPDGALAAPDTDPATTPGEFSAPPGVEFASAEDAAPSAAGRNATLVLEARAFANRDLDGNTTNALRFQAHYFGARDFGGRTGLIFNLRARTFIEENRSYRFADDFNVDVQELALRYALSPETSLQFGRINIRNGVASGFNPTDWFKDGSLVVTDSAAPADRRNERLGVVALTGTTTLGQTLMQIGYRPQIDADPGTVWTDRDNFGLGLDRTNPSDAWFVKVTPQIGDNLSFTANALLLDDDPGIGFELSGTLGDNLVLYSEMMAQKRLSIASEALGASEGSAAFRDGVGAGQGKDWHYQAALGLNWALSQKMVGARDISLTMEYHLNTAGLSSSQIDTLSGAQGADEAAAGAIHGIANRRQEPLARNQIFTRLAWNDFWGDSDLSLLGFYVPADGSGLAQLSFDVPVGDNGNFNLRAISSFGDSRSVYGANPTKTSVQMGMTYTF